MPIDQLGIVAGLQKKRSCGKPAGLYAWSEVNPAEYQRARAMTSMVARTFGLESYQVLDGNWVCRFQPARRVAAAIMHELMGIGNKKIARVFRIEKTTARKMREGAAALLAINPEVRRLHDEALAAIRKRWPEYEVKS